ncbi:DNA-binding protein [Halobacteriales archaeon QS_8_65_32]|jgi:uncharacterized Zn finger protein (UPF0148 family)|nr:MAG: DNA-binding protein [Halobacteriales archaeon QS_8_65_32]
MAETAAAGTVDGTASTDGRIECAYCGRRFAERELLALHRGVEHAEELDEREREAFDAAYGDEEEELRHFRLKALLALMALYFLLLFAYSVFG